MRLSGREIIQKQRDWLSAVLRRWDLGSIIAEDELTGDYLVQAQSCIVRVLRVKVRERDEQWVRNLFVFFLLWICALPAFADSYLMYPPGQTRAAHIWNGPEPIPGTHCPIDWKVVKWDISQGDTEPRNYSFDGNKTLTYDKPAPPAPTPPGPNPSGFEKAVRAGIADGTIDANASTLTDMLAKEQDAQTRQDLWTKFQANPDFAKWLDAGNISAIEKAAADNLMPLK